MKVLEVVDHFTYKLFKFDNDRIAIFEKWHDNGKVWLDLKGHYVDNDEVLQACMEFKA
jgi:hypothetical protein